MYKYDPESKGFYLTAIHGDNIPHTAITLRPGDYERLVNGQSDQLEITMVDGYPVLQERPAPSAQQMAELMLTQLDIAAAGEIERLRPAVDGGYAKAIDVELLAQWQRYRYELPDVRSQPGWPEQPAWPQQPGDPATE